ncbi:MAG: tetratricopeptide repeat protein [Bacteroidales bacterium]|nr:tetratricopeptide repeat protein [Bacteroidales bacterium]
MSNKTSGKDTKSAAGRISPKTTNNIFIGILIILTFLLYGNTIRNHYSLDDYHIAKNNPDFEQGISAIPRIFTTMYASENGLNFGYRPLVRTSFAIEFQFFGKRPYVSHFINIIFYLIAVLMLYKILRRLLRDFHYFLPFIIALLFLAHPIHTEVVASLKNRDELFVLIFCLLALDQAIKYADTLNKKHIYWAMAMIGLSFLSKPTTAAFFFIIPISLYFFTNLEMKKIVRLTAVIGLIAIIVAFVPFLYLPKFSRPMSLMENPLAVEGGLMNHIAYAGFTLMYYLKLLVFPHPLRYYYGYNMFPDINFSNIWVILGIILHIGLLIYAIMLLKRKHILSYAILVYFISIAMFSNLVRPAPGIIAERFLLIPSIGFSIVIAYFLYWLFWQNPAAQKANFYKLTGVVFITIIILIPYSAKTFIRNTHWRTEMTLYRADMPHLYNSVKGNELYANEIMKGVNRELAKPVNVLKFIEPRVKEAIKHWERAAEIQPDFYQAYRNLGIVYNRIYKDHDTAIYYFNKVLEHKPDDPMTLFNLGLAYEGKQEIARAIDYLEQSLALDPKAINTRSRLANILYGIGEFERAVALNQEIMEIAPNESLPYVNLGNYFIFQRDTLSGIRFYERAVELGAPPDASYYLSMYYRMKGETEKADYYRRIAENQQKKLSEQ